MLYSLYQSCIAGASSFCNSSFLYLQPCVKWKSQVVEELIVSVSALNILFLFIFVFAVVIETEILCSHILSVISPGLSNKSDNSDSEGQIEITLRFSVNKESL